MNDDANKKPKELAIPGFHAFMEKFIIAQFGENYKGKVLDAGAGQGAFSQRLMNHGYNIAACDLDDAHFTLKDIEFKQANIADSIPWEDGSFDLILALELTEHVDGVMGFFEEINRVLTPGGFLIFTTPNILSLKSRIQFLLSGFFYSFKPISETQIDAAADHITPLTLDLYDYRLRQCGLSIKDISTDKIQRSSTGWLLMYPLIKLYSLLKYKNNPAAQRQNSMNCLLGRKLIVLAQKTG